MAEITPASVRPGASAHPAGSGLPGTDPALPDFRFAGDALPKIVLAGYLPIADRGFATTYCLPLATAIHLYDYHARVRIGAREFAIRPSDLTITPPGAESRYHLDQAGRHWVVHARFTGPGELCLPIHLRPGSLTTVARERLTRVAAHHRRSTGMGPSHPARGAAAATLLELLCWLSDRLSDAGGRVSDRAVARAAEILRQSPDKAWRSADLARAVGLSPSHLARRFRAVHGHTLARFHLLQRMAVAQTLLAASELPIAAIARQVGVPDPHHFNKMFRRIAGQSPSAFRADNRT